MYQGDHVLTFNWFKVRKNDVVVFINIDGSFWVKRVKKVLGSKYLVQGDNKKISSKAKVVLRYKIVGKVVWKY